MQYRDGGGPNGGGDGQDYYYKNRQKVIEPIKGTKVAVSSQSGPTSICGRLLDSSVVAGGLSGIPITPNSVQAGMMGGTAYPAPTYQAGASATATAIGALSSRVDVGVTLTNVPQDANVMRVMWCFRKTGTTNWSPWAETTIPGAPAPATTLAVTFTYGDIQSGVAYDYGLAYVSARGDLGAISAFISNQAAASVSIPGTYFVGGSSTPITPTTSGSPTTTAAGQVAGVTQAARMQFTANNQPTDGSLSRIGLWYRQTGTSAWTNWSEIAANGTGIYDVTITSLHNGVGYDFGFTYVSIAGAESTIYSLPSLASTALSVGTNFLKAGVGTAPTLSPSFVSSIVNSAGGMTSDLTLTWTTTNEPTDGSLMGIAVFLQTVGGGGSSLYAEIALAGSHAYSFTFTGLHNGASYVVSLAYAYTNGTYGSTISSSTIALPAIGIPIAYQLGGTGTPPVISGGAGTTGTPTSPNGVSTAVPITFTITNQPTDGSLSRLAFFYRVTGAGSWTYYASIPATGVGTLTPPASSGSMTFVYADLTNGQGYDFGVAFENAQGGESAVTSLATMTIQQLSLPATSATPMPGGQTLSAASSGIGAFSGVGGPNALLPFTMTYNDWTVGNAPGWFLAVTAYFRVNGSGSTTGTVLGDFIPGAGTNAVGGTAALPAGGTFDIGFAYRDGRNNHSTITWPAGTSGIVVPGVANTALVKMPSAIKSAGPAVTGSVSVRTARGGTTQTITTTFTETDFTTTPSWFNGAVIVVRINGDTDGARQTTVFASQISAGGVCTKVIPVTVGETIDVGLFYLDVYGDASATTWYVSASADPDGGFIDTTDPNKGVSHTRSSPSTRAVVNSDKTTNLTDFTNTVECDPTSIQAGLWATNTPTGYAWSKSGTTLSIGLGPEVFEWTGYATSGDVAIICNASGYTTGAPTSGYMAYVDHTGYARIYKMVSGTWSGVNISAYNVAYTYLNQQYMHHLKVVVQDVGGYPQIWMQFNNAPPLTWTDTATTPVYGSFGLLVSSVIYTHDWVAKQSLSEAANLIGSPNIDVTNGRISAYDTSNVNGTAAATVSTGAIRANTGLDSSGNVSRVVPLPYHDPGIRQQATLSLNNVTVRSDGQLQTAVSTNCFTTQTWNLPVAGAQGTLSFEFTGSLSDTGNSYANIFVMSNVTSGTPTAGYVFERVDTTGDWTLYKYNAGATPTPAQTRYAVPTPDTNRHRYLVTITHPASGSSLVSLYQDGVLLVQGADDGSTNGAFPQSGSFGISVNNPTYWIIDPQSFNVTTGTAALEAMHPTIQVRTGALVYVPGAGRMPYTTGSSGAYVLNLPSGLNVMLPNGKFNQSGTAPLALPATLPVTIFLPITGDGSIQTPVAVSYQASNYSTYTQGSGYAILGWVAGSGLFTLNGAVASDGLSQAQDVIGGNGDGTGNFHAGKARSGTNLPYLAHATPFTKSINSDNTSNLTDFTNTVECDPTSAQAGLWKTSGATAAWLKSLPILDMNVAPEVFEWTGYTVPGSGGAGIVFNAVGGGASAGTDAIPTTGYLVFVNTDGHLYIYKSTSSAWVQVAFGGYFVGYTYISASTAYLHHLKVVVQSVGGNLKIWAQFDNLPPVTFTDSGGYNYGTAGLYLGGTTYTHDFVAKQSLSEAAALMGSPNIDVTNGRISAYDTSNVSGTAAATVSGGAIRANTGLDSSGTVAKAVPLAYHDQRVNDNVTGWRVNLIGDSDAQFKTTYWNTTASNSNITYDLSTAGYWGRNTFRIYAAASGTLSLGVNFSPVNKTTTNPIIGLVSTAYTFSAFMDSSSIAGSFALIFIRSDTNVEVARITCSAGEGAYRRSTTFTPSGYSSVYILLQSNITNNNGIGYFGQFQLEIGTTATSYKTTTVSLSTGYIERGAHHPDITATIAAGGGVASGSTVGGQAASTVAAGGVRAYAVIDATNQIPTTTPFTAQGSMQPFTTDFAFHTAASGVSPNVTITYWIDNGTASTNVTFYRSNGVNLVCPFNGTASSPMGTATTTLTSSDFMYFLVYWSIATNSWHVSYQLNSQFTPAQIGAAYVDGIVATIASASGGGNRVSTGGGTIGGCPEVNEPIECRRDGATLTLRAGDLRIGDELRDFNPGEWNRINDFKVGPAMIHEVRFVGRSRPLRVDASHLFVPANGEGWINVANLRPGSALKRTGGELIVESQVQIGWGQMAHISCDRMRYLFDETSSHNVKYR